MTPRYCEANSQDYELDGCPICDGNLYSLYRSFSVCEDHLDTWIVTRCPRCLESRFDKKPGLCRRCKYRVKELEKLAALDIPVAVFEESANA